MLPGPVKTVVACCVCVCAHVCACANVFVLCLLYDLLLSAYRPDRSNSSTVCGM